jgi:FAD/FMN-containing dehydrogenase
MSGPEVLTPASVGEAAEMVRAAEASARPLVASGLGNHLPPGIPQGAAVLSLARLSKVLRYEPGDFTIGVQAGMPLDDLRAALAERGQEIAIDFPSAPRGTVGGALAQDRGGPRRSRYGGLRSCLIGIAGIRGGGRAYKAGGMVVKNVAGFDVGKLLVGSSGTLGPIVEANFKVRPIPAARSARRARFSDAAGAWRFARGLLDAALEPAVLVVLSPEAAAALDCAIDGATGDAPRASWTALWLFEGSLGAVGWLEMQADGILASVRSDALDPLDAGRREKACDFLAALWDPRGAPQGSGGAGDVVLRLAALPSEGRAAQETLEAALARSSGANGGARPGNGSRGQAAAWSVSDVTGGVHIGRAALPAASGLVEVVAEAVRPLGGSVDVLAGPAALRDAADRLFPDPNPVIAGRIRAAFDPRGIFSGRRGP